ncbi:putative endoplasmic reticulum vesicle protein [Clavispora lusitaniae]|uniref:Endoplasmic reticulum vesicle protein n=1 Tax=Clavispora lusitaniae TaxID=36911 RepID=A0AA91Q0K9_CLALS|nr:putative endoplasmic reticulum vesicle protein [Clavispora lusitaniae]
MIWNLWFAITFVIQLSAALLVELPALEKAEPVCIRDFIGQDQLVVVNVKTSGRSGDGQRLQMVIKDTMGNILSKRNEVNKDVRVSFTTYDAVAVDICFTNILERTNNRRVYLSREVELEVESGSSARDWNAVQAAEKLRPNEIELKKVEELAKEISHELRYLKAREERMRDTNESTNSRVKYFSIIIVLSLVGLGVWQIQYLRHYFKVKHII